MTSCAITGPRPSRFQFRYNENDQRCMTLKEQIRAELIRLCEQGVHVYYIGGALGVDMWCAEILLELQGSSIRVHTLLRQSHLKAMIRSGNQSTRSGWLLSESIQKMSWYARNRPPTVIAKGTSIWWIMLTAFWLYMTSIIPFPAVEPQ